MESSKTSFSSSISSVSSSHLRLMFAAVREFVDIAQLTKEEVQNILDGITTVIADCDGVLWLDNEAIPGSADVINKFIKMGKTTFLLTNNSTKPREEFAIKAKRLGFHIEMENIISTAVMAALYLQYRNFNKKVYLIGSIGLAEELERAKIKHLGIGPDVIQSNLMLTVDNFHMDPDVGAVIVGFDEHFSYLKLLKAATYLNKQTCLFLATNTNEQVLLKSNIVVPGTGAILKSVETAAQREAIIVGKPNSYVANVLMNTYQIDPSSTLLIGDKCETDILFGNRCGFRTLLVLSGSTTLDEVNSFRDSSKKDDLDLIPDYYVGKLGDLSTFLDDVI